ncbi:unnamed protein product [Arctia plantaginis]|uniref:Uncharacterized protein n=1 Tax=Arctia plantaginis TaxID=874455 RepID=A0A8S1AN04_ARCPL|nr:unnamed protein product [Arctia plantaginis]CAB3248154.1 unnamed protein product [Arctia plantaginis]
MKGGLCIIYTSLLTISVLSSCALFILVVSEALHGEGDPKVDLSGLHNVSQKTGVSDRDVDPGISPETSLAEDTKTEDDREMIFPEALSLNSVTTDG